MMESANSSVIWEVENVPESERLVKSAVHRARLCATMMGLRVLRHRTFYCNYIADDTIPHFHDGKWVGSRSVGYTVGPCLRAHGKIPTPNMNGVYNRPNSTRGQLAEWHGAMGFPILTFSTKGLVGALPLGYGRLQSSQMVAHFLNRNFQVPIQSPWYGTNLDYDSLNVWAIEGYHPLGEYLPWHPSNI